MYKTPNTEPVGSWYDGKLMLSKLLK